MFIQFLTTIGNWFIPLFILLVFLHGAYKKVPLYDAFVDGAKEGLHMTGKLLPYIVGIYVAVDMFRKTGALDALLAPIHPMLTFFGVPDDVVPLMIVRPLSGPAALGITSDIIEKFGPDSFAGRLASTIDGSCDTTLYIIAVYFASVGIKNARYSLPVGILADISGFFAAIFICKVVFL